MKLRKVLSGVVAAAVLAFNSAIMTSAATTYDPCDIDHDGIVGLSDYTLINKYLNGLESYQNYNRFDTNKSMTVDMADANYVLAKNLGQTYSSSYFLRNNNSTGTDDGVCVPYPTVTGFVPNSVDSINENREYMRYSYKTHSSLANYTINYNTSDILTRDLNTRTVIGYDDRYLARGEENSGIVKLSTGGTGFVVGDHQIATAAHALYDLSTYSWVSNMSISCYDDNGNLNNIQLTPIEAHIPKKYVWHWSHENGMHTLYDYGLITVKENLSNRVHFSLGTSYNVNSTNYSNVPVYVTGCPESVHNASNSNSALYTGVGRILGYSPLITPDNTIYNDYLIKYNVDATGGDSGSPVYTITRNVINGAVKYTYTALGISTNSANDYNFGTCITKYQLQFYNKTANGHMNYQ